MKFAEPQFFNLFWLLLLVIAFLVHSYQQRRVALKQMAESKLLPGLLVNVNLRATKWRSILISLGIAVAILALARPQWGFHWEEIRQKGNDVFIAIDVSKSMLAEDVKPNRLDRAKREVKDLLKVLKGDRVGLIAFAGTAFVLSPLTLDASAVRLFLEDVNTDLMPQGGTAIGEAIQKALTSFPDKKNGHNILILLTDGEDLEGGALAAAEKAKKERVKIYVVGVGTLEGAPIPITDKTGTRTFIKDKKGQTVLSRLDLTTLSKIGVAGVATSLAEVYEKYIIPMEKKELETTRQKRFDERFQWPLFLSLLLIFGCWLIPWQRKKKFEKLIGLFFLLWLIHETPADAASARSQVEKGNHLFNEEKWDEAASKYTEAQLKKADSPKINYNLANALYKQEKFAEAQQLYEKALGLAKEELLSQVYYNLGNSDVRLGKLESALKNYEQVLSSQPEDEDARFNYELVKKMLEKKKKQQEESDQRSANSDQKDQKEKQGQKQEEKESDQRSAVSDQKEGEGEEEKKEKQAAAQKGDQKEGQDQKTQQQVNELSKQEAEILLNAAREEEITGKELKFRMHKGKTILPEKDW